MQYWGVPMENENVIPIDVYSLTACLVKLMVDENELATGTCFFHKKNEQVYLITNRHNVTVRHNETNQCLSPTLAVPNKLKLNLLKKDSLEWGSFIVKILDQDDNPLWIEHPIYKDKIDVVAIPVEVPEEYEFVFVLIEDAAEPYNEHTTFEVGEEIFILGYPLGINAGGLPLWKRASVASEPNLKIDGLPKFLIDTASRPGMSGSPVILKKRRPLTIGSTGDDGGLKVESRNFNKFIGIYSGRLFASEKNDAQIGIVWKSQLVDEIVNYADSL